MFEILSIAWILAAAPADGCGVSFVDGWAPQAPPVAMMWAGYGTLRNDSGHSVTIASASSPDFEMAQIHETREEGGQERMHRIDPLTVPAGGRVALAPRGRHLMLMRPTHSLDKAQAIVVEFHVDGCAAPVRATLPIRHDAD
jgi:periplasmic copper chaperone A